MKTALRPRTRSRPNPVTRFSKLLVDSMPLLRRYLSLNSSVFSRRQARNSFAYLNPEARNEAVQEVVANSFAAYRRLIERGKIGVIAPKPLASFAIAQTRTGRKVSGHLNCHDVSSRYCRNRQGITLQSLEQLDSASGCWQEILFEDPSSTPADIVAIRVDFQNWLKTLSDTNEIPGFLS